MASGRSATDRTTSSSMSIQADESGNLVRRRDRARFSNDVADERHVLRGHAGDLRYHHERELWLRQIAVISPVRSGSRVRGRFMLADAKLRKAKELQSRTNVTIEIEGREKPALVADWIGLIYFE